MNGCSGRALHMYNWVSAPATNTKTRKDFKWRFFIYCVLNGYKLQGKYMDGVVLTSARCNLYNSIVVMNAQRVCVGVCVCVCERERMWLCV
jgi:hypothetical protein